MRIVQDNEWVRPILNGYRMTCCKCGATHSMDFKVTVAAAAIGDASKTEFEVGPFDDLHIRGRMLPTELGER